MWVVWCMGGGRGLTNAPTRRGSDRAPGQPTYTVLVQHLRKTFPTTPVKVRSFMWPAGRLFAECCVTGCIVHMRTGCAWVAQVAVADMCLRIPEDETFALLGENGAGTGSTLVQPRRQSPWRQAPCSTA